MVWQDPVPQEGFTLAKYWPYANSGAQLADLIRIDVVYRFGGVYIDSDVTLRKPLDALIEHCEFFVASEDGIRATNAIFGAAAAHAALGAMVSELEQRPPDWSVPPSVTTGPEFFARILKWRGDVTVLPRETFYPYNWHERRGSPRPCSYGVHEWAGSWRKKFIVQALRRQTPRRAMQRLMRFMRRKGIAAYRSNEWAIRLFSPRVYAYSGAATVHRKTVHGQTLVLDGTDLSITPELVQNGYYELREELFLRRHLRGGDYFVDVGANVGVFALLAASIVGPFGRVFAYEPNPIPAGLLTRSAAMNWVHDRVVVRHAAVGERHGTAELHFTPARLGDATIEPPERGTFARSLQYVGGGETKNVSIVSLDDEFPIDAPLKMLKIDAEGGEARVLAGASRLFAHRCIEYVMLEAVPEVAGDSWQELLKMLESICQKGYRMFVLGRNGRLIPTGLRQVASGQGLSTRNIVLKASE